MIITRDEAIKAFEAVELYDTKVDAAKSLGITTSALYRRIKHYHKDPEAIIYRNAKENRVPYDDINMAWIKNDEVSMLWKKSDGVLSYTEIRDQLIEEMVKYAPVYKPISRSTFLEQNLLIIDAADIHVGKLCRTYETGFDEYNIDIAVKRVEEAIEALVVQSQFYNPEKIVFVIGNDVLHIDNARRTTTSGTPQDTDGQWWDMYLAAKMCYIKAIERLIPLADVHVVFCPSNHDYVSGWMLADTISSWFANNGNVHFGEDNKSISINHRKYIVYGSNLIGFTHGDGAKEKDIPNLMQYEAREMWGKTTHAYMYTHHTHHADRKFVTDTSKHRIEKDHIGITVLSPSTHINSDHGVYIETVRSPSPPDGWHSRNGYVNKAAIEAFIHHHKNGQIARLTHFF